jgi:tRNA(Ile)-lysidine synthase
VDRIRAGETFTATLAGARIEADGEGVWFFREPGEARRSGPPPSDPSGRLPHGGRGDLRLPVGQSIIWDGRYELVAAEPGLAVRPLQGLVARLPATQRQALKAFPPAARPSLPALLDLEGGVSCPILAGTETTRARCLVVDRFEAATGRVDQEPAT